MLNRLGWEGATPASSSLSGMEVRVHLPSPNRCPTAAASAQDRQAAFVLRCIAHLRQVHGGQTASRQQQQGQGPPQERPYRLVLVAYSMGGVVARDALRRLAADPSFGGCMDRCHACKLPSTWLRLVIGGGRH